MTITMNCVHLAKNGNRHAINRIANNYQNPPCHSAGAREAFKKLSAACMLYVDGAFSTKQVAQFATQYEDAFTNYEGNHVPYTNHFEDWDF